MIKTLLLTLLFLPAVASAQQLQPVRLSDFSGGINDRDDPTAVAINQSPSARNVIIDEGSLRPRKGVTLCGTLPSGNTAKTFFTYDKADGSSSMIVSDNSNYYQTKDCVTYIRFKDNADSTSLATYKVVRDRLWVTTRSTNVFTWDGSTTTILDGRSNTPLPAVPSCTYLEFFVERVFCARTTDSPSGIYFSDITDSAGNDLDPSTGTASWPATNVIQIAQDSGGPLYALKSYRGRLYAFKGDGIWRISFASRFDISVEKTMSNVGTRFNDSLVEIDGFLYFIGPDGGYRFNGDTSVRITENIRNKFDSLVQPANNQQFKNWTAATDFDDGTFIRISTLQTAGSIEIAYNESQDWEGTLGDDIATNYPPWKENGADAASQTVVDDAGNQKVKFYAGVAGSGYTAVAGLYSDVTFEPSYHTKMNFSGMDPHQSSAFSTVWVFQSTGTSSTMTVSGTNGYAVQFQWTANAIVLLRYDDGVTTQLSSATFINDTFASGGSDVEVYRDADGTIQVSTNGFTTVALSGSDTTHTQGTYTLLWNSSTVGGPGELGEIKFDDFGIRPSTGSWISNKFNAVLVSSWTTFEVDQTVNGGTLEWQWRAAATEGGVDSESWTSITPGTPLPAPVASVWVQFQSSFTASTTLDKSPRVNAVTINYSQGAFSSQPISAHKVNNRYWVTATSGTGTNNNIVMVKSRDTDAFMFYDLQIGAMTRFNDKWYAIASTHSAIYQLEAGTSDDGEAIDWEWQTGDIEWGAPWVRKELQRITIEYRGDSANSVSVGHSRNSGSSWSDKQVDMSGSGRDSKTLFVNGGNSFDFRMRITDADLDESATILGITGWARIYKVLE